MDTSEHCESVSGVNLTSSPKSLTVVPGIEIHYTMFFGIKIGGGGLLSGWNVYFASFTSLTFQISS